MGFKYDKKKVQWNTKWYAAAWNDVFRSDLGLAGMKSAVKESILKHTNFKTWKEAEKEGWRIIRVWESLSIKADGKNPITKKV